MANLVLPPVQLSDVNSLANQHLAFTIIEAGWTQGPTFYIAKQRRFNDGPQLSPGPIQNRNTARDALVFPPLRVAGNFARPRVATVFLALAGYSTRRRVHVSLAVEAFVAGGSIV